MRLQARALTALTALCLSIISTTFVFLTLKSERWSVQHYYAPDGTGFDWSAPLCSAARSPFYRCEQPNITFDAVTNITTCNFTGLCAFYKPYGRNATSCRLLNETGDDPAPGSRITGSAQECQSVHISGYLQIASSALITLGLVTLVVATAFAALISTTPDTSANSEDRLDDGQRQVVTTDKHHVSSSTSDRAGHHHHNRRSHHNNSQPSPQLTAITVAASAVTAFLCIGAILQIATQFFAVLGLVVSATPSPQAIRINTSGVAGAATWIMDIALTRYATAAWTTALACAVLTTVVFRGLRPERV